MVPVAVDAAGPVDAAAPTADAARAFDAAGADASVAACAEYAWSFRLIGGQLEHMATDVEGNVFVAGRVTGPFVDWGGGVLAELGDDDIVLAKYDTAGVHQWSHRLGGPGRDYAHALAVGPDGSVVIAGLFNDTASFGGDAMTPTDEFDAFVARFGPGGEALWSRQLSGPDVQAISHVAVADSGVVAVAGTYETSMQFAGATFANDGSADSFVATYSGSGAEQWAVPIGGDNAVLLAGIAASDAIVVAGRFFASLDLGAGAVTSVGPDDLFVVAYDLSGEYVWSRVLGGEMEASLAGVAIDRASNDVVAVGSFRGVVDFGGGDVVAISSNEQFVARYGDAGELGWVLSLRNAQIGAGAVSVGSGGAVVIAGEHTTADFGGGLIVSKGTRPNVFVASYTSAGAHVWSRGFGGLGGGGALAASADETGCAVIAGRFMFEIDFGDGPLTPFGSATEASFVAQVVP